MSTYNCQYNPNVHVSFSNNSINKQSNNHQHRQSMLKTTLVCLYFKVYVSKR